MLGVIAIICSYLIGSIIFSITVCKLWKGIDIRQHGSGNAGATNTMRVLGTGAGIIVLALDILKGVTAVWIGKWLGGDVNWVVVVCGLAVIAGHNWPLYFSFRGGKGIATTIGVVATLSFLPSLWAGIVAILLIVITRYVSLGSIVFTLLLPISFWLSGEPWEMVSLGMVISIMSLVRHRTNIIKLIQGRENKIGSKSHT